MSPTPTANWDLAQRICTYLAERSHALVVIEDLEGYLTTPAGTGVEHLVRNTGHGSYAFIADKTLGLEQIILSLRVAYSLPSFNVICSEAPQPIADDPGEQGLHRIANNTRRVFIGAYDGESYLSWTPGQ